MQVGYNSCGIRNQNHLMRSQLVNDMYLLSEECMSSSCSEAESVSVSGSYHPSDEKQGSSSVVSSPLSFSSLS